jgi:ABC-type multidrug transport system ATPase subunit/pSer/pThr/pTyr-binding forkhead associated (FHA) protein
MATVPASGATIGSTAASDIVVPAAFLAPVHARIWLRQDGWAVELLASAGSVLLQGAPVRLGVIAAGDMFRLADRIGNFVTVKVPRAGRVRASQGSLRAELPLPGQSYLIGSDASCRVRLDHPLVQARHVAVRRDDAGSLWLTDRGTAAGTYVNGRRLRGQQLLAIGDVVQIGPFSARLGPDALEPLEQVAGVDIDVLDAKVIVAGPKNGPPRTLLDQVSLHLPPSSMTAVAGPSGAGKTTLMRLLSGQQAAASGAVRYNGTDLAQCRQAYAALMGYVPQEDVVHADLTVDEALGYVARLRLGRNCPRATRNARVEHVLALMGLSEQHHQLVRTLSGGQRKRVSIACELLNEPQIIFLDEPTSGLDPGLDKRMMLLLRLLADQGRTVVLTTHAIAHVDVCDTLVLVGPGGHVIYAGPPEAATDWFGVASLGDVFAMVETPQAAAQAAARVLQGAEPRTAQRMAVGPAPALAEDPSAVHSAAGLGGTRAPVGSPVWRRAVAEQARIFAGRYVRLLGRDRAALSFSLLQGIAVALLTALVAPKPFSWSLKGNAPMFVFGCAAVWFGMIGSVRELVKEQHIWRREFLAGGNVAAYLVSKIVVLGTLVAFQAVTLTIALALTLGLPSSSPIGTPFIGVAVALWLAGLCGMAVGLAVSVTASSADRAMSLVPYLLITQLVLCGVLFPLGAMTFASWLMPARWSVSALGSVAGLNAQVLHQSSGLYPHSAIGLASNWLVLVVLAVGGLALTARALIRQGERWSVGTEPAKRGLLAGLRGVRPATSAVLGQPGA